MSENLFGKQASTPHSPRSSLDLNNISQIQNEDSTNKLIVRKKKEEEEDITGRQNEEASLSS